MASLPAFNGRGDEIIKTSMSERRGTVGSILAAKAATGVGTVLDVAKYRHVMVAIIGADSPNLTVKAQGSPLMSNDANLDFSAAADGTNPWDYIGMYDAEDGQFIDGDTGIVFAGSGDVRLFVINTDALRSLNFSVTARSAGNVTVKAYPVTNQ